MFIYVYITAFTMMSMLYAHTNADNHGDVSIH